VRHTSWAAHGRESETVRVPCQQGQIVMPITLFLCNSKFDPETRRIMGLAFEMARLALGLEDRGDLANEVIAKKIIELAKAGERNPEVLCEAVVKELRAQRL
jgi:hypothetical protein